MNALWPSGAHLDERGQLWIGDCAASALVGTYGTPLYVFDEQTLRTGARGYLAALARFYPGTSTAAYASKAYLTTALVQLLDEEGLDLDVVSGGELYLALEAGFPAQRIHFHGNNKTAEELEHALAARIGRIVVDNLLELETVARLAAARAAGPARIWLRLAPGIDAHTHTHIQTGRVDTKFGLPIATGDAERAVAWATASPHVELLGLHAHIGSQIYDPEPLAAAAGRLAEFAVEMRERYGFELAELSPGGGWGVPMTTDDSVAPLTDYVAAVAAALVDACRAHDLPLPHLVLEPGRSLVGPAAVALYRVGARKFIPGVRTYVSVDGGMADNIRPALYGASYKALLLSGDDNEDLTGRTQETVTIVGKYCESGDVLIRDIVLPQPRPGDLLAVPMAGAYTLSMASNYNLARRPAVVLVGNDGARLIQRRESYADLVARDVALPRAVLPLVPGAQPDASLQSARLTRLTPRFYKYQALGNDYIVLDPQDFPVPPGPEFVRRICDRHLGVGSDGILWGPLEPAQPFSLRLFNPDGGEFGKSGNGLRIFARYLWDRGLPPHPDFAIITPGGPVVAHVLDAPGDTIAFDMGRLSFDSSAIPPAGVQREVVAETIDVAGRSLVITAAGIGNPHCVVFVDSATPELAQALGPQIETHAAFPARTNVQFAEVLGEHDLRIEIWERGAGYTLASGTSSCAAAGAAIRTGRCTSPITVTMPGGSMLVDINSAWEVRLTGTVGPVCRGELSRAMLASYAS